MTKRGGILILFIVAAVCARSAGAQSYGTELPFVLGSGARAAALGSAGTTLRGDASVQYYNPSALGYLEWKQFVFFRTSLYDSDASYHTLAYSHPLLNYGTIGVSLLRLDVGKIEGRDASNQLISGDLHNSQTRLLLGYGANVTPSIVGGVNIKVDNQSFAGSSGTGVGLDFGISATQKITSNNFVKEIRQGFVFHNLVEPSVKLDQEDVSDPMQLSFGGSVISTFKGASMETTLDVVNPRFSPLTVHFGQEIRYTNAYSFRFGMEGGTPSYGFGAHYKGMTLDYAFRSEDIGSNHRFALAVRFGNSVSERKDFARQTLETEVNQKINRRMSELEQQQITQSLQRGDSLYNLEQYDNALNQFETVLLWDPENQHASEYTTRCRYRGLMKRAQNAVGEQDYVQAIVLARKALGLAPQDPEASEMIALCEKQISSAENIDKMVNNLLKTSIDQYANRQYATALSGFEEAVKLDPTNELALEYRTKCETQIKSLVQRYILDSRKAAAQGDYSTALSLLRKARSLDSSNYIIDREIHGIKLQQQGLALRSEKAPAPTQPPPTPKQAPVDRPGLEKKYKNGMSLFDQGDFENAAQRLTEVWSIDPDFHNVQELLTKAYMIIGMRHYSRDNYADAIEVWKKVLAVDPSNAKVKRYLLRTEEELKKLSRVSND